jgi:hypothetical protein
MIKHKSLRRRQNTQRTQRRKDRTDPSDPTHQFLPGTLWVPHALRQTSFDKNYKG